MQHECQKVQVLVCSSHRIGLEISFLQKVLCEAEMVPFTSDQPPSRGELLLPHARLTFIATRNDGTFDQTTESS
jgi:hypothetical protein